MACFEIKPSDSDLYFYFTKEGSVQKNETISTTVASLKSATADLIVDEIVKRLEAAFGEDISARWRLESIEIPVKFRTFIFESDKPQVKIVAAVLKDDFSVQSLIRFLPLEYKMKFFKPKEKDIKEYEKLKR